MMVAVGFAEVVKRCCRCLNHSGTAIDMSAELEGKLHPGPAVKGADHLQTLMQA